jgi:hypothetical protein
VAGRLQVISVRYRSYSRPRRSCSSTVRSAVGRASRRASGIGSPSFNDQTTFVTRPGISAYRVCAYIYTGGDDTVAPEAAATTIVNIPPTRAELLAKAVAKCHKIHKKTRRSKCLKAAKKRYGPKK